MDSNSNQRADARIPHYVLYDKVTGTAIGRHRYFDLPANQYVEVEAEDDNTVALFADDKSTLDRVSENSAANLAVLKTELTLGASLRNLRVTKNRLVEQPRLVMYSDKDELEGNGEDSATLTIMLENDKGKAIAKAKDEVLVTTTRGKLSARGGLLKLENGRATLTLRSVPETVQVVTVRCELVDGGAEPAEVRLAFV